MSATTKMFKTDYRLIPKLTHDNYPTWRKKVRRVLVAMRAYNILTGDELFPEGNGSAARTLQKEWHQRANDAIALIHLGCTDDLLPWIDDIDDPVEMWQTLQGRLDNTTNQVGRTQIVRKFHALRPSKDEKITQYFTRLIDLRKKLIGSPETISDETMKTYIFSTMPKEFETTIKILEQQIPVPTAQQVMDRLREDADRTELTKEIGDESTGSALYSHRGNNDKEYSCTHCKMNNHTTESCGILKRLNSGGGSRGFNRKKGEEVLCFHCGRPGHTRAECHSRQRGLDAQNRVNKRSTKVSMAEANTALTQHGI